MSDFRYGPHAPQLDVASKKKDLKAQILQRHPRAKDMYAYVQSEFKEPFGCAYNNRCAYCGVPIGVLPVSCFEVDHIVCQDESEHGVDSRTEYVHDLNNLALACSYCNRKKSNFLTKPDRREALSPDGNLGYSFVREDDFSIGILDKLRGQEDVERFYDKLSYGSELRRIDYLLSSLIDLRDLVDENTEIKSGRETVGILDGAIGKLIQKRNRFESQLMRLHMN